MAYISQLPYDNASAEEKARIDKLMEGNGRLTNMKLTLLHSEPAFHALMEWYTLERELEKFLPERTINFFSYAISNENDCLICNTFFTQILVDAGIDFDTFAFSEEEKLLIDYGRAIVQDANRVPSEIFDDLKKHWNEEQIVLITAFATIMIATNLINKTLQVELDERLIPYTKQ